MKRDEFPCLNGLVYLNSAFTALTPRCVVDAIGEFYLTLRMSPTGSNAKVNTTIKESYSTFAQFLGCSSNNNMVFTMNCSEAINYAARALTIPWGAGDSVVISGGEYAPNVLPWLRLRQSGVEIRFSRITDGQIDLDHLDSLVDGSTRLIACSHVSNIFGSENPIPQIAGIAHSAGALLLVDGAQAVGYLPVNVSTLGVDLYAVSGHKALGPTGSGLLVAEGEAVSLLEPLFIGDAGVKFACNGSYEYNKDYTRFFAGMTDTAGIIGLAESFRFLQELPVSAIADRVSRLTSACRHEMNRLPIKVISHENSLSMFTFSCPDVTRNSEIWAALNNNQIMTQLLEVREFPAISEQIEGDKVIRFSFHLYNDENDLDRVVEVMKKLLCV